MQSRCGNRVVSSQKSDEALNRIKPVVLRVKEKRLSVLMTKSDDQE